MLTARENFWTAAIEHKVPEWVPSAFEDVAMAGGAFEDFENGPVGGGLDGWGVEWHSTVSAAGQPVPVPNKYVLTDITAWEDQISFPNLDAYDWEGQAAAQLAMADPAKPLEYGCWNGQFLRMTHLMGFAEALVAMMEEPEASYALLDAITDYKIRLYERIAHWFKPDIITNFVDVATESGLFVSPDKYRELIKPMHTKANKAIADLGIIPFVHCCGKCDSVIGDFIDEGAYAWTAAQSMNDIESVLQQYASKIAVIGGYNSNGEPGRVDASNAVIDAEVKRCVETYAPYGSYVFMGFRLVAGADPMGFLNAMAPINEAFEKYKHYYK